MPSRTERPSSSPVPNIVVENSTYVPRPETNRQRAGSVGKTRYGAWLVAFSAPMVLDGEDVEHDAASSLDKGKRALRDMASRYGFTAPWRWDKHPGFDLYFLEGQFILAPEASDEG